MYQEITLVGNLGRDPEMRYTRDGTPVTDFSMATNEKWPDSNGNPQERTTWWKVTFWRRQAEVANEYLRQGSLVMVKGVMNTDPKTGQPRIWTDRDGNARCSLEVTGRILKLLGGRSGDSPRDEDVPEEPSF
jgi:single-strand DNA-binding protein